MTIEAEGEIRTGMRKLTLFTKPNCPLCDKALEAIERARGDEPFELEEINILSDLALYERYRHDIPVLLLEGEEIFRHRVSASELVLRLRTVGGRKSRL